MLNSLNEFCQQRSGSESNLLLLVPWYLLPSAPSLGHAWSMPTISWYCLCDALSLKRATVGTENPSHYVNFIPELNPVSITLKNVKSLIQGLECVPVYNGRQTIGIARIWALCLIDKAPSAWRSKGIGTAAGKAEIATLNKSLLWSWFKLS